MKMDSEANASPPPVLWAQTKALVLLTFNVECEKPDIDILTTSVCFNGKGTSDQRFYKVQIPLYAAVEPENSAVLNKGRYIEIILSKENKENLFWPRLTSDNTKHHWLRIDFNRWQDDKEDEKYDSDTMVTSDFDSCDEEEVPDV